MSGYTGTRNQNKNSLDDQLKKFWEEMMEDVQNTGTDLADFKTQQLPLARIKKVRVKICSVAFYIVPLYDNV